MKRIISRARTLLLLLLIVVFTFAGCSTFDGAKDKTTYQVETSTKTAEIETKTAEIETKTAETETTAEELETALNSEIEKQVEKTVEEVEQGKDIATDEIPEASQQEEAELETDAVVEQENIAYNGGETGNGKELLGKCTGLTYYSQADSRWGSVLYTIKNEKTQTIKSSGCGPTSAAMLISSSKGAILPPTVSNLFIKYGYRTKDNGTAWACWPFVADYFNFKEYHTTTSFDTMVKYLSADKNKDGVSDYFVIASCGSGLFTSGGHYIFLAADKDKTITVYDPYLYNGKFNTASRKAAGVTVSGNSAFLSETSFKKYANVKNYWIFSNDYIAEQQAETKNETAKTESTTVKVNYVRYIATESSNLNVRESPGGKIIGSLKKGTKVKVKATYRGWSQLNTAPYKNKWVSSSYLSATPVNTTTPAKTNYKTTVGKTYKLKQRCTLYSKANLSGTEYIYKANTTIKVLSHASTSVDYIYVPATGRYAHCKVNNFI